MDYEDFPLRVPRTDEEKTAWLKGQLSKLVTCGGVPVTYIDAGLPEHLEALLQSFCKGVSVDKLNTPHMWFSINLGKSFLDDEVALVLRVLESMRIREQESRRPPVRLNYDYTNVSSQNVAMNVHQGAVLGATGVTGQWETTNAANAGNPNNQGTKSAAVRPSVSYATALKSGPAPSPLISPLPPPNILPTQQRRMSRANAPPPIALAPPPSRMRPPLPGASACLSRLPGTPPPTPSSPEPQTAFRLFGTETIDVKDNSVDLDLKKFLDKEFDDLQKSMNQQLSNLNAEAQVEKAAGGRRLPDAGIFKRDSKNLAGATTPDMRRKFESVKGLWDMDFPDSFKDVKKGQGVVVNSAVHNQFEATKGLWGQPAPVPRSGEMNTAQGAFGNPAAVRNSFAAVKNLWCQPAPQPVAAFGEIKQAQGVTLNTAPAVQKVEIKKTGVVADVVQKLEEDMGGVFLKDLIGNLGKTPSRPGTPKKPKVPTTPKAMSYGVMTGGENLPPAPKTPTHNRSGSGASRKAFTPRKKQVGSNANNSPAGKSMLSNQVNIRVNQASGLRTLPTNVNDGGKKGSGSGIGGLGGNVGI